MDWELILPIGFLLLAPLGLVFGVLAAYQYFRREQSNDTQSLPVAMAAVVAQYGLVFALAVFRNYRLLPTILIFLTTMALLVAIWLGLRARSRAGYRIAMAGLFTLSAYICKMASDYYQFAKFYHIH